MKKLLKIFLILFYIGVGFVASSAFWIYLINLPTENPDKYEPNDTIVVKECSMEFAGYLDGHLYPLYHKDKYFVNDVVAFDCHSDKCNDSLIKRIADIKKINGERCYYLLGDPNPYTCPSIDYKHPKQLYDSFDARDFGWLCGDEIDIQGVVYKL